MTDDPQDPQPGRIDLRSIDDPPDALQAGRVVAAAMSRARLVKEREPDTDVPTIIAAYARPVLAAAAVLLMAATGTLLLSRSRANEQPASVLATWVEAAHVPTNGELLATFQGYDR